MGAVALLGTTSAIAATRSWEPHPEGARTFISGPAGWTAITTQGGGVTCGGMLAIPGVTCPQVTAGWEAGGHLRTSLRTALGLLSSTTVDWTSPSFTPAQRPDVAALSFALRAASGSLLNLGGATVAADLVELSGGGAVTSLLSASAIAPSASFNAYGGPVSPALLTPGRTYALRLRLVVATPLAAAVAGSIDLDDVALELVDLAPPSDLGATVSADTVGVRVHGSVDPHGQPTTVRVDYGPTSAYGSTTSATVSGSGPQAFSLPLAGLRAATRYRFRVTATSPDGSVSTADAGFAAPAEPAADGAPMLVGASTSRQRIAVFDLDAAVTGALVEVLDAAGTTVLGSFPDADLDGSATIALPVAAGSYRVRVVRTRGGVPVPSASVEALYASDRAPPDAGGVLVVVVPWSSAQRTRTVTVIGRPADAVSAQLRLLDAAEAPLGAPVALGADGSGSLTLPDRAGSYRVRASFFDLAGNESTARSLQLVLTAPAGSGERPANREPDPGGGGTGDGSGADSGSGGSGSGAGAQPPGGGAGATSATTIAGMRAGTSLDAYPLKVRTPRCAVRPGSSIRPAARNGICPGRRVVGSIAAVRRTVGGGRVTVRATVPGVIGGAETLQFGLTQRGGAKLRAVRWTLGGRALPTPLLPAALLRADGGAQTLAVRLTPRRGPAVTVRISFRTRAV
ncbi:MAG TPA: fibronectin type III domain-containing protein [Conexibacter sp.]|nr:fibronectin type III domain-containing protein [Conexibacter sp.]